MLSVRVSSPAVSADRPVVRLVEAPHAERRLERGEDFGAAAWGRRVASSGLCFPS